MSEITIGLSSLPQTWTFSKEDLLSSYPESLITNILELSSDTYIEFTQPFITPQVMSVLVNISQHFIPTINPSISENLVKTGNYLNIDILAVIGSPKWAEICRLHGKTFTLPLEDKRGLFRTAVNYNYVELIDYLIKNGVDPCIDDNYAIQQASNYGYLSLVNRLLQDPRVNPGIPTKRGDTPIRWASCYGHINIVNRLLLDPRVDPSEGGDTPIHWACQGNHTLIVERLLQDPRVNTADTYRFVILRWLNSYKNGHDQIRLLISKLILLIKIHDYNLF